MSDRTEQARAEAGRAMIRMPFGQFRTGYEAGHEHGVRWADANHPAVEALARVRELHREVIVWELDSANGTWIYKGDEKKVLTRLCAECSSDELIDAVEDKEFTEGEYPGEVTWPCATYKATEVADDE